MRPTRLELEGFISFRERTTIDFAALDLFGITGPTGAGKTSLLDSIIFALYGKTPRLGEKAVQELISQGASEMQVLLEFRSGNEEYRVLRIVKRKGSGRTQIEQRIADSWEPVAGSTRELRDRIEEIVGLDFEGFTKTVVLPQGQFDRFLRGDGAARRKILGDLLGLEVYERMMKRANEIARDARHQCDVLTEVIEQQFSDVTPQRLAELELEITEASNLRDAAATAVASLERILPLAIELKRVDQDAMRYQKDSDSFRESLEAAAKQVGDLRQRLEQTHLALESAGYDATRHLEVQSLLPVARQQAELRRSIAAIELRLKESSDATKAFTPRCDAARVACERGVVDVATAKEDAGKASAEWHAFRSQHGSSDLLSKTAHDAAELAKQTKATEAALGPARERLASLREQELAVETALNGARATLDRVRMLHAAANVRQHLKPGDPCPVCEQLVSSVPGTASGHSGIEAAEAAMHNAELLREQIRKQATEAQSLVDSHTRNLTLSRERLQGIPTVESLTALAAQAKSLESAAQAQEKSLSRAIAAEAKLRQELNQVETRVALANQAQGDAERELAGRQLELLNQSGQVLDLAALDAEARALEQARQRNETLVKDQIAIDRAIVRAEVDERNASERLASCLGSLSGLDELGESLRAQLGGVTTGDDLTQSLAASRVRLVAAESRLGAARMARQSCTGKSMEAEAMRRKVEALGVEIDTYSRLGTMLRTDQFGAWILKDAFARLAYEGSLQLEALSNGRYTFAAGTDDFAVCDRWNAGERRSVHTLSGGESFLASLSLALALSRSLPEFAANRQRFHLDSLFLDEGFSTLDAETLNTVLEAVELLQADGRLIGVISHSTDLADRLPGRIEVMKGASGSSVVLR